MFASPGTVFLFVVVVPVGHKRLPAFLTLTPDRQRRQAISTIPAIRGTIFLIILPADCWSKLSITKQADLLSRVPRVLTALLAAVLPRRVGRRKRPVAVGAQPHLPSDRFQDALALEVVQPQPPDHLRVEAVTVLLQRDLHLPGKRGRLVPAGF